MIYHALELLNNIGLQIIIVDVVTEAMVGTMLQALLPLLYIYPGKVFLRIEPIITFIVFLSLGSSYGSENINEFRLLCEGCACPGLKLVYECIVDGTETTVATVWSGTAFNCPSTADQISLRHSEFENGSAVGVCSNGAMIMARGISGANDTFISRLTIIFDTSLQLVGTTIQCANDDGRNNHIIGNHTITITIMCSG